MTAASRRWESATQVHVPEKLSKKERKLYWRRIVDNDNKLFELTQLFHSDESEYYRKYKKYGNPIDQDGNEVTDYNNRS